MDFFRDDNGTLCIKPAKYIAKMMDTYTCLFATPPSARVHSPTDTNNNTKGMQQYQSLIGMLEWNISIGCFDVQTAIMTLSPFHVCPWRGHLDRAKCIFGYISRKFNIATNRIRTDMFNYSGLPKQHIDWSRSMCGDCKEVLPSDIPTLL